MIALITGASSGIGRDMARLLAQKKFDLILVARRLDRLQALKEELQGVNVTLITHDLSKREECFALYEECKNMPIDYLINNAGFGTFGEFTSTSLEDELRMIDTNDVCPHILMKLFLPDFVKRNTGKILNVCSSASFYSGPLMATYYATKGYLYRLSLAIAEELRRKNSKVQISVLCPGPISTEFQDVAKVHFATKPQTSKTVAQIAISGLEKGKRIIIPSAVMRLGKFGSRFVSEKFLAKIAYHFQHKKIK